MKVTLTKAAKEHLLDILGAEPTVKIHEVQTTGWGATYVYELAQAEQLNAEEIFKVNEMTVLIEPSVINHLDGDIVIDHNKNYGFILKNSFEVLTFGMKLIKNS